MYDRAKLFDEYYKLELSNNLPQVYAGAFYSLNSKDFPFGADGKGYMLMLGISWSFDTGLSTLNKARAHLERKKAAGGKDKGHGGAHQPLRWIGQRQIMRKPSAP
jgi:outer membrane protein